MGWIELFLCAGLLNQYSVVIVDVLYALSSLLCFRVHVSNTIYVKSIDREIRKRGYSSCTHISFCEITPGDGFHILFQSGKPVVAYRKTVPPTDRSEAQTMYTLLSFGKNTIDMLLYPNSLHVSVVHCEQLLAYSPTSVSSSRDMSNVRPWATQEDVLSILFRNFEKHARASVLVSGKIGSGKSELGVLLAHRLHTTFPRVQPIVVHGLDLTAGGCSIMRTTPSEINSQFPYILVLDEIDRAFAVAEHNDKATDSLQFGRLAASKTSLCGELSRLSTMKNLILIATTNVEESVLDEKYPAYIRVGRFDSIARV